MALAWCGAAAAQIQPLDPLNPQQPQQGQQPQQNPGGFNQAGMPNRNLPGSFLSPQGPFSNGYNQGPDEFTSIWSAPSTPEWTGFPAFPARLQGYGNYPIPVDPNDPTGTGLVPPLPAAEPEPNGWPSWVRLRARKPLPFSPEVGLLIAQSGRAWSRPSADEPFVPSLMHDEFASLPAGAGVELRTRGALEVLLHQSSRLEARGRTRFDVVALDEQRVTLAVHELTFLRLRAKARAHTLQLPDGSALEFTPSASNDALVGGMGGLAALFGGASLPVSARPAYVEIARADEPSYYGGRATITNYGGDPLVWRHALGEAKIEPGQRVTLFLSAPVSPTADGLAPGDARVERDGAAATCRAVSDTEVRWCGARLAVPEGGTVQLRSLGGPIQLSSTGG